MFGSQVALDQILQLIIKWISLGRWYQEYYNHFSPSGKVGLLHPEWTETL